MDISLLKKLYKIQSKSGKETEMINFIEATIKAMQLPNIIIKIDANNIYVTKGVAETYPTIVCHTDQVQQPNKNITIIENDGYVLGFDFIAKKPAGLGADDKNGIFIALQAIKTFPVIKAAFFREEETGCKGSNAADMTFFLNSRYVVQCDRKNGNDFIIQGNGVDLNNEEFAEACKLEKFGYKECNGGSTDVVALKGKGLKVACCNISCGYYNPHTDHEVTCIQELENCWEFTKHILSLEKSFPHEYQAKAVTHVYYGGNTSQKPGKQLTLFNPDTSKINTVKKTCTKINSSSVNSSGYLKAKAFLQNLLTTSTFYDLYKAFIYNHDAFPDISYAEFQIIYCKLIQDHAYAIC